MRTTRPHALAPTCACCSVPLDVLHFSCTHPVVCGSLNTNELCGISILGEGTYTAEGINKLCESLKTSSITSLRCTTALPLPCC